MELKGGERIVLDSREVAVYEAGERAGTAKGLETAATYLEEVSKMIESHSFAATMKDELEKVAAQVAELDAHLKLDAPFATSSIVANLVGFGPSVVGAQKVFADFALRASAEAARGAGVQRTKFAERVATLPSRPERGGFVRRAAVRIAKRVLRELE